MNIVPLFTETEKNNIVVLVYTHQITSTATDLGICTTTRLKVDLIDTSKREFTPAILFCVGHALESEMSNGSEIANQSDCLKH